MVKVIINGVEVSPVELPNIGKKMLDYQRKYHKLYSTNYEQDLCEQSKQMIKDSRKHKEDFE